MSTDLSGVTQDWVRLPSGMAIRCSISLEGHWLGIGAYELLGEPLPFAQRRLPHQALQQFDQEQQLGGIPLSSPVVPSLSA
jgi:hypothetical protein